MNQTLFGICVDGVIRRCIPEVEMMIISEACHSLIVGGFSGGVWTTHKILQYGYCWPTICKDSHDAMDGTNVKSKEMFLKDINFQ